MRFKRFLGFAMSGIMMLLSLTSCSEESTYVNDYADAVYYDEDTSESDEVTPESNEEIYADYTDTYEVEGGYIYFNADTGEIVDANASIISADIPASINGVAVKGIGKSAFSYCENLVSITIPDSVFYIDTTAFENCEMLSSVEIPSSVVSIGNTAFRDCGSLTNIEINSGVASIGDAAFLRCNSLINIEVNSENAYYSSKDGVLFNKQLTQLVAYPKGKSAESYDIPYGITNIGFFAFASCDNLKNINIPESVTSIDGSAFSRCDGITSINLPSSVMSVSLSAFDGCSNLTSIDVSSGNNYYSSQDGVLFNKDLTELIMYPYGKGGDYVIPYGVKNIGRDAFGGNGNLAGITIPNSVINIGDDAFVNCDGLTSLEIPSSVVSIGIRAFETCSNLKSVTMSEGVNTIGMWAFCDCGNLTSLEIPSSVNEILSGAFKECSNLKEVTILSREVCVGNDVFDDDNLKTVYCYQNSTADDLSLYPNGATIIYLDDNSSEAKIESVK